MQLNNFLQRSGGTRMLSWDVFPSGPSHQVVWTAITYSKHTKRLCPGFAYLMAVPLPPVRGVQYAKCVSSRQNVAMEDAARLTLDALHADLMRGY